MDPTLQLARVASRARVFRLPEPLIDSLVAYLGGRIEAPEMLAALLALVSVRDLELSMHCMSDEFDAGADGFDPIELRTLALVAAAPEKLLTSFMSSLGRDKAWDRLFRWWLDHGIDRVALLEHCLLRSTEWGADAPTGLGRFVLAARDDHFEFIRAFARRPVLSFPSLQRFDAEAEAAHLPWWLFRLLLVADPPDIDRAEVVARDAAALQRPAFVQELLRRAPARFASWAIELVEGDDAMRYASLLAALHDADPVAALRFARRILAHPQARATCNTQEYLLALKLVARADPTEVVVLLEAWAMAQGLSESLDLLASLAPDRCEAVLLAHTNSSSSMLVSAALKRLLVRTTDAHDALAMLAITHDARVVRDAAKAYLEGRGETVVLALEHLLVHAPLEARVSLVELLGTAGGARGRAVLRAHLDHERSGKVRKAMLALTGEVERASDESRGALTAAADEMNRLLTRPPLAWFDAPHAPTLRWIDDSEAPPSVGSYLLHCQSAAKGLELDPRVAPMVHALSPASMAPWARALLTAWEAHDSEARFAWCLVLAAAMSAGATADFLGGAIERWAVKRRAMSVMGVQVLAMLGSDDAVHLLTRIRDGHTGTLGSVAESALEAEAGARGLTREALEDAVVPRFLFDRERVWSASYGKRGFRVQLADDLLLNIADARGKSLTALPKPGAKDDPAVSAATFAAWKVLRAGLNPTVERELARMERALVEGRVWSFARWQADVARHPVLGVLASRLVWQLGDGATVRPKAGALVRADGEAVVGSESDRVRLLHPAEADAATLRAWVEAFTRELVRPAFEQCEREVYRVQADQRGAEAMDGVQGRVIRAGPSARKSIEPVWVTYGWSPLPTVGYLCPGFERRFVVAGVTAVLTVGGMALWREDWQETEAIALRFQTNDAEPRTVAIGEVPPRIYSEAVRAVMRMSSSVA